MYMSSTMRMEEEEDQGSEDQATPRQRSQNFTIDEDRVLREQFAKYKDFLTSPQSNKVTNKGKQQVWKSIAASVSALGYALRKPVACKTRWKNLSSTAKRVFNEFKCAQNGTTTPTAYRVNHADDRPIEGHNCVQGY